MNGSVIEEMLSSGSLALALNGYDIGAGLRDVDILVKRGELKGPLAVAM